MAKCPPRERKICQKLGKRGKNKERERKNWGKEEKSVRKGKNREGSFTLPLLTDKAGYATEFTPSVEKCLKRWSMNSALTVTKPVKFESIHTYLL